MAKMEPITIELSGEFLAMIRSINESIRRLEARITSLEERTDLYGDGR